MAEKVFRASVAKLGECPGGAGLRRQCLVNSVARKAHDAIRGPTYDRLAAVDRQHQTALQVLLPPVASAIWPHERLRRVAGAGREPNSTNRVLPRDSTAPDSGNPSTTAVNAAEPLLEASGASEETVPPSASAADLRPTGETSSDPDDDDMRPALPLKRPRTRKPPDDQEEADSSWHSVPDEFCDDVMDVVDTL